jgi:hypothetical protein
MTKNFNSQTAKDWRRASSEMETLCDALAQTYWDARTSDEATAEDVAEIREVLSALCMALQPWRQAIVATYRAHRRYTVGRYGRPAETLLGAELPEIPGIGGAETAGDDATIEAARHD